MREAKVGDRVEVDGLIWTVAAIHPKTGEVTVERRLSAADADLVRLVLAAGRIKRIL